MGQILGLCQVKVILKFSQVSTRVYSESQTKFSILSPFFLWVSSVFSKFANSVSFQRGVYLRWSYYPKLLHNKRSETFSLENYSH